MTCLEIAIQIVVAVLTAAATLAAAYFGAKFAFEFQNRKNEEIAVTNTVKSANMAIFSLMRSHHDLTAIKLQYIDPNAEDEDRHFSILPSSSPVQHLDLAFDQLSYLLSSPDPNLLNELALAQSEVNATIDVVNARSRFHIGEFQPLLDTHTERLRRAMNLDDLEGIVGARVTHTLRSVTNSMVESVPGALDLLASVADKLHKTTKSMFPTHGVIHMTFKTAKPKA